MNITLKKLKDINSESCITIILNTHRTSPDNSKDAITLKNLIKEVETRLFENRNKRDAQQLVQRLLKLEDEIDHKQNLESLILFVNEDIAEYTRLPIKVKDRAIIDYTFATRDLVRAMHHESSYYILVLSQEKARLIEAVNDKIVTEIGLPFPIVNKQFDTDEWVDLSDMSRQSNLLSEFFNQVDKEVNIARKNNPLLVLICSDESNYHEYIKVADEKNNILDTFLNGNRVDEKAHHIIDEAWKIMQKYVVSKNNARKNELKEAVNSGKFLSDVNDIWKAILQGKVHTLFIEEDLFQPGYLETDGITFVSEDKRTDKEVVDDIYDEMIEFNMKYGGDTVFLPKGDLTKFNGFGAVTRY